MKLSDIPSGSSAKIVSFEDEALSLKLMEMGCTPESEVNVIRKAPFNGPIMIKLWNYSLCLRKEEAEKIIVE